MKRPKENLTIAGFPAMRVTCPHCQKQAVVTICTIDTEYSCDCGKKFDIPKGSQISSPAESNSHDATEIDAARNIEG
jgi:transposase-like protein